MTIPEFWGFSYLAKEIFQNSLERKGILKERRSRSEREETGRKKVPLLTLQFSFWDVWGIYKY
jgi:hypothetical protein